MVGAVAVVVSQGVILTSWGDAKAGTVANVVLLAAVGYGYASQGPISCPAEYRRRVRTALAEPAPDQVVTQEALVTEDDVARLPEAVAAYVRRSGAMGRPHVRNFRARIHGRIRAGASTPWWWLTFGPDRCAATALCRGRRIGTVVFVGLAIAMLILIGRMLRPLFSPPTTVPPSSR